MAAACGDVLTGCFPQIDDELTKYIKGVLDGGAAEFDSGADVFEEVGAIMQELDMQKSENELLEICSTLHDIMKRDTVSNTGQMKILNAPVSLGSLADNSSDVQEEHRSIWMGKRDDGLQVDQKKLNKAEAKIKQKQTKRANLAPQVRAPVVLDSASVSQQMSRKDMKQDAAGTNRSYDVRIENFDLSFGEKVLLKNSDLILAFGRRYGLVGRNGLGKTTLLRAISNGDLRIPSHIRSLHVEQEVVGDDTVALDSVLECDIKRQALLEKEKTLNNLSQTGSADGDVSAQLAEVYAGLQAIDADRAPARAAIVLAGLGFNPQMQKQFTKEFSGGWRMRLALARALFSKPDLLLLDEPTNMLDMKAIIWLENYLQTWPTTLLVVSHDRAFLNNVVTDVVYLHTQQLDTYKGNYEVFNNTRTERLKSQQREYEAQKQYREHVQVFIDRFRFNAKRASLVQSKLKLLEKLPELKPIEKETEVTLKFPEGETLSPPILQLDELCYHYTSDRPIFKNVCVSAAMESRICIVGENGAGKTTLLKILLGELEPVTGIRHCHRNLRIGYFSQHHLDQLDMNMMPIEVLQQRYPGKSVEFYRQQLGGFGVSGELALQSVASLSGGQKSRVAFAQMNMSNPNFFILDEPTNHLDMETIEALGKAINKFKGGVMLVSHDERLIRMICKEMWVCVNQNIVVLEGGMDAYKKLVEAELADQN